MQLQLNQLTSPLTIGGYPYSLQSFVRAGAIEPDGNNNFQCPAVTAIWKDQATFMAYLAQGGNPFSDSQCRDYGAHIEVAQIPGQYVAAALGTPWTNPPEAEPVTVPTVPSGFTGNGLVLSTMLWGVMSLSRYAGTVLQVNL